MVTNMENKPKIRFKSFSNNWDMKPLSLTVNSISTGKIDANAANPYGKYKFFTCSREDYLTDIYAFDGDAIIINGNGDLGITKTYSGKFNAYQRTYVLMNFNESFKFIGKAIPVYLPEKIRKEAIGGAMPYIKIETIANLLIGVPDKKEQDKISNLLEYLDQIIIIKKEELVKMRVYKKSLLLNIFPKENQDDPKVRFLGCSGKWNEDKFGNLFVKLNNNSFSRDMLNYVNGDIKNIHYGDILIKYDDSIDVENESVPYINAENNVSNFKTKDYLKSGDIVFADTAEDETAGKMVEIINNHKTKVLSGLHTFACRPKIDFAPGYLGIYMNTSHFHNQLIPYMQGTKVTCFNYEYLSKVKVKYPDKREQERIVELFNNLNVLISNKEKELFIIEKLQNTFETKMFV